MTVYISTLQNTGMTLVATMEKIVGGDLWNNTTFAFEASPSFANASITLTEGSSQNLGAYTGSPVGSVGSPGWVRIRIHDTSLSNVTIGVMDCYVESSNEVASPSPTLATQTSVDDLPTNSELTTALSGLATAANLATVAGYIDTEISDIQSRIPAALVGGRMDANVGAISSDSTAADNAEAFFDGTGYAGTNNVIPTVSTLTGHTPQTGDSFAYLGTNLGLLGANLAISADLYTAYIEFVDDDVAATDEYSIRWRKNGVNVTSGITTPLIQVINFAGSDLVASTAMTQIGSTGAYKYSEATNRIAAGQNYEVKCTATIDGSARTFSKIISRDSQ